MWIKNVLLCVGVALAALGAQAQTKAPAAGAAAAAVIGYVKTVKGEAFVDSGGQAIKAVEGTPLKVGDVVRTGANGSAGITLKDNTVMSFGPSTQMYRLIAAWFAQAGLHGRPRMELNHPLALRSLVAAGQGQGLFDHGHDSGKDFPD